MSQKRAKEPCSCSAHHTMLAAQRAMGGGRGGVLRSTALQTHSKLAAPHHTRWGRAAERPENFRFSGHHRCTSTTAHQRRLGTTAFSGRHRCTSRTAHQTQWSRAAPGPEAPETSVSAVATEQNGSPKTIEHSRARPSSSTMVATRYVITR